MLYLVCMFWKKKTPKVLATEITDANFHEKVRMTDKAVFLDFWGKGCNPCSVLTPIVNELAAEYEGRAVIGTVDTGRNPGLAQKFGIRSVPTLVFIKNRRILDRYTGLVPKPNLEEIIDTLIEMEVASPEEEAAKLQQEQQTAQTPLKKESVTTQETANENLESQIAPKVVYNYKPKSD